MSLTKVSLSMIEGVTGASSTNSASVNTAAINAALSSGAKLVALLNDGGTYLVDGTLNVPAGVSFIGVGLPTIKAANNSFPSGGQVIELASATGSIVEGFKIDANRQNNGGSMFGVYGSSCVKCSVENCYVINSDYGIYFLGGNTLKINNNTKLTLEHPLPHSNVTAHFWMLRVPKRPIWST